MLIEGFPGPYAAYVYKTIHNSGILKLMEGVDRSDSALSNQLYLTATIKSPVTRKFSW